MIDQLAKSYNFKNTPQRFPEDPKDTAHWSIGDSHGNEGSRCEDRVVPRGADVSNTVSDRAKNGTAELLAFGEKKSLKYPITCADLEKKM